MIIEVSAERDREDCAAIVLSMILEMSAGKDREDCAAVTVWHTVLSIIIERSAERG